ncbi:MAG: hypothetical protein HC888_09750, partial [Candidatus Competibacteraceae bacterium]|nr:hypothetical protein [Candidatus Competibacteraceae bacterium]
MPVVVDGIEVAEDEEGEEAGGDLVDGHDEHHEGEREDTRAAGEAGLADALDDDGDADQEPEDGEGHARQHECVEHGGRPFAGG